MFTLALIGCNYDSIVPDVPVCAETITYETHTKEIINLSCATVACHAPGGDGTGDYTSYNSMRSWLNDEFFKKVLDEGAMPPAGSPALSEEDKEILRCWILDNYPEN